MEISAVAAAPGWYAIYKGSDGNFFYRAIILFECDYYPEMLIWYPVTFEPGEGITRIDVEEDGFETLIFSPNHKPIEDYFKMLNVHIKADKQPPG